MKRTHAALFTLFALLAGACGGGSNGGERAGKPDITMWVAWSGPELEVFKGVVAGFERREGVRVEIVGDQNDTAKLIAAIQAGNGPDLDANFQGEQLGRFCEEGAYADLNHRLAEGGIDVDTFTPVAQAATAFGGKRCALPYMADTFGLYYNKDLFRKAGIQQPPRTMTELTETARRLTERNADGSIEVAGFVPLMNFYQNYVVRFAPLFGARYFDDSGRPGLASEQWRRLFTWQKSLVDFYGHDNIRTFAAGAGQEFSASHAFQAGKVAMMLDGEWRTLAIAEENPALAYGTAPLPVDEAHPELYGASQVGMGLLVIPRGAKNPDLAFGLARYLAVDTEPLIAMANGLHNIPTTKAALASPELQGGDNFGPFLTAAGHPLSSVPPIVVQGSYFEPISGFAERWQSGAVTDLDAGLAEVDKQISAILSQD